MSLHASMSSEAKAALEAQKRTSTIFSVIISVLAMALLALVLYVISLAIEKKLTPDIVSYGNPLGAPTENTEEVVEPEVTDTPSAPTSTASANVITAVATSSVSAPTFNTDPDELSFDSAEEIDFEFDTSDASEATATLSDFGASTRIPGTIGGYFYDFKQSRARVPVKNYSRDKTKNFRKRVQKLLRGKFASKALAAHFKSEQELFLRYVAIPFDDANKGPKYFGLEKLVKPSGWIVHYKGKVKAPRDGRFRLVGVGDDYLAVGINGKPHLIAPWSSHREALISRGANSRITKPVAGPFGVNTEHKLINGLLFGRWFTVKKGDIIDIDIAFGEDPGGKMGYILMIEEKGVKYQKQKSGSPILPPFTVGKLNEDDLTRLKSFPGWKFKLDDVPVFEAQQ